MSNRFAPSLHSPREPVLTPERKLWRAVLEQARLDCDLPLFSDGTAPMERVLARRLLRAASAEETDILRLVCDFAGVPADRVILWARRRYPPEQTVATNVERTDQASDFSASMTAQIQ